MAPPPFPAPHGSTHLSALPKPLSQSPTEEPDDWRPPVLQSDGEPVTLRPRVNRPLRVTLLGSFALVWNAILVAFLIDAMAASRAGTLRSSMVVPLVFFALVGVMAVFVAVHQALQLGGPRITLTIDRAAAVLGEPVSLGWRIEGRVDRLRRFSVELEGWQYATYRRGKHRRTDSSRFARVSIVDQPAPVPARGDREILVPADSMHSFHAEDNEIVWSLSVQGEMARWADAALEFPLIVHPRRP